MKLFLGNADKTMKVACASWPLCTTILMHMYNNYMRWNNILLRKILLQVDTQVLVKDENFCKLLNPSNDDWEVKET